MIEIMIPFCGLGSTSYVIGDFRQRWGIAGSIKSTLRRQRGVRTNSNDELCACGCRHQAETVCSSQFISSSVAFGMGGSERQAGVFAGATVTGTVPYDSGVL